MENTNYENNVIHEDVIRRVKEQMPQEEPIYEVSELFRVFGDSSRSRGCGCGNAHGDVRVHDRVHSSAHAHAHSNIRARARDCRTLLPLHSFHNMLERHCEDVVDVVVI